MKISQSLLFAYAAAQGEDRWGSTDYYSFNYGFGGKQDSGIAFGQIDDANVQAMPAAHGVNELYGYGSQSAHYMDNLHYNGLLCWMCDFRLDLATEAESESCTASSCQNAYARCLKSGMLMRCRGEQRTCMFEERRRHGVVYSVCTGCKQTDACVAHWRRNQRFTLPFMNFGDMSLRNLPTSTGNLLDGTTDQLPNHRPIYVDDECSTYQETRSEAAWRKTAYNPGGTDSAGTTMLGGDISPRSNTHTWPHTAIDVDIGTNNEVYPMGWVPLLKTDADNSGASDGAGVRLTNGMPFSKDTGAARVVTTDLQFTGHRVNLGLSYSKFAYDGSNDLQLNAQLSQWESTCRWCCHARPDTVCNIEMKTINSSPFSTKCGNAQGTRRDADVTFTGTGAATNNKHDLSTILANLKTRITTTSTGLINNQSGYWQLLTAGDVDSLTEDINGSSQGAASGSAVGVLDLDLAKNRCSLSNAQWTTSAVASEVLANTANYPRGIHNKFRFFQPFNIAQSAADYLDGDTNTYKIGPRFWMQMFQRTPQYDLSAWYSSSGTFSAKFPSVGEGRNSVGMDKYAGRGNKSRWVHANKAVMKDNPELQHFFQQQTDMVSQENRDFFDGRAKDAATNLSSPNMHLKRYDNTDFWNFN